MKKFGMISLFFLLSTLTYNGISCTTKQGQNFKVVTAYICEPGPGTCLRFQGKGDIWIAVPGILRVITIKIPALDEAIPMPDPGYIEHCKFFLFTDASSQSRGIGLLDGCLHFKDSSSEFKYYELELQDVITDFETWEILTK